jgi:hypothetical protein
MSRRRRRCVNACAATAEIDVAAPPPAVFAHIVPIELASIFTGYGPLPAVVGTRDQTGPWDTAGRSRTVLLADGSTARERLTRVDPPACFSYLVEDFSGAFRFLVASAHGQWWFAAKGAGTHIKWTYEFQPRSRLSAPAVWLIAAGPWRRYMDRALRSARRQIER